MATGWTGDGAVQQQIDDSIEDAIKRARAQLPDHLRDDIQSGCDQTIGRAIRSLVPLLGDNHPVVEKLSALVRGPLPDSADAFTRRTWFQEEPGGEGTP